MVSAALKWGWRRATGFCKSLLNNEQRKAWHELWPRLRRGARAEGRQDYAFRRHVQARRRLRHAGVGRPGAQADRHPDDPAGKAAQCRRVGGPPGVPCGGEPETGTPKRGETEDEMTARRIDIAKGFLDETSRGRAGGRPRPRIGRCGRSVFQALEGGASLWRVRAFALAVAAAATARAVVVDLRPDWDAARPLPNPDKGWYHHYFDNSIDRYLVERDEELTQFPGMDHIYLRLAWAYLEPEEGRFRWEVIDEPIAKWTARGLGIAFRITCKETSVHRPEQQFATPRWVRDAGARGGHYRYGKAEGPDAPWEPDFDDPIFFEKLDAFLAAFAARYDGRPWLRYVDIGSVGDWGEGHTWAGSRRKYSLEVLERHVDLHRKHFRRTQLIVSDDLVYSLSDPADRQRLHEKILAAGIGYRDDSILVDGYFAAHAATCTVRSPELFRDAAARTPTVLELEHYGNVKTRGNWKAEPGSSLAKHGGGRTGPDMLRGALALLRATYIGYHGYAREWLADNPDLTVELLNRCGYWFFPHSVELPDAARPGKAAAVAITWENRGVARAYRPYALRWRLEGPRRIETSQPAGNDRWEPGAPPVREAYELALPADAPPGDYEVLFKLRAEHADRDVRLPLATSREAADGFYRVGRILVEP